MASLYPEKMTDYTAIGIAEGFEPCRDDAQMIEAWQYLVDTGLAWRLQGWFGRQARTLIDAGLVNEAGGIGVHTGRLN